MGLVFFPYDITFGYRVSGVFFECVANDKYVISNNIPTFSVYHDNNQPFSLINSLDDYLMALQSAITNNKHWNASKMDPGKDWKKVLYEK